MTALPSSRLALNPIQWMATDDGWLDPSKAPEPAEQLALVKKAAFDGVMAAVPAEPGRGELPLVEILGALGNDFGGWLMVEVDKPDIQDPYESAVASATWMAATFGGGR